MDVNQRPSCHAFFNGENGFAVLKVKAKGLCNQVVVIGSLPSVNAGEWVRANPDGTSGG